MCVPTLQTEKRGPAVQSIKLEHLMLQPGSEFSLISQVHWLRVPLHLTEGKSAKAEMRWSLKTSPLTPAGVDSCFASLSLANAARQFSRQSKSGGKQVPGRTEQNILKPPCVEMCHAEQSPGTGKTHMPRKVTYINARRRVLKACIFISPGYI